MIFSIFLDIFSVGLYFFQKQTLNTLTLTMGLVIQAAIVLALLILLVTYKGKRYGTIQPVIGFRYFSFRYTAIILSFTLNAIVEFLYVLNYLGINQLIFLG